MFTEGKFEKALRQRASSLSRERGVSFSDALLSIRETDPALFRAGIEEREQPHEDEGAKLRAHHRSTLEEAARAIAKARSLSFSAALAAVRDEQPGIYFRGMS